MDFAGERSGVRVSFCAHETRIPDTLGILGILGIFSGTGISTRKIPLRVRASRASRCYRGTPLSGNPYYEQRARRRCADRMGCPPVVPTNDANRFRFGNSSAFPNRCRVGHLRAKRPKKRSPLRAKGTDCNLTAVNAFLGNVLETSRIQFINHPLARA